MGLEQSKGKPWIYYAAYYFQCLNFCVESLQQKHLDFIAPLFHAKSCPLVSSVKMRGPSSLRQVRNAKSMTFENHPFLFCFVENTVPLGPQGTL